MEEYGGIALDPCSNNRRIFYSEKTFAVEQDGLLQSWATKGLVYVNPPYGKKLDLWIVKAIGEAPGCDHLVMLLPARTDRKCIQRGMQNADATCFVKGRLKFVGAEHGAPFPSMLLYWGAAPHRFLATFEKMGVGF